MAAPTEVLVYKNRYRDGSELWWVEVSVTAGPVVMTATIRNLCHLSPPTLQAFVDAHPYMDEASESAIWDVPIRYSDYDDKYYFGGDDGDDDTEIGMGFGIDRKVFAPLFAEALGLRPPLFD